MCRLGVNFQPVHETATNREWKLPEVVLIQFVSPDDEHDVLETCRELQIKNKFIERNLCVSLVIYQEFPPMVKRPQRESDHQLSSSVEGQLYLTCASALFTHVLSIKPLSEDYHPRSNTTKLFHSLASLIPAAPYGITAEWNCWQEYLCCRGMK